MLGRLRPLCSAPLAALRALSLASVGVSRGIYVLTGNAASLLDGNRVSLTAGSYGLTGQAATLTATLTAPVLSPTNGVFVMSGKAASLLDGRRAVLSTGPFVLSGKAANVLLGHRASLVSGTYSLSGKAATLKDARIAQISAGALVMSGKSASLLFNKRAVVSAAAYVLSGKALDTVAARRAVIAAGVYDVVGVQFGAIALQFAIDAIPFSMTGGDLGMRKAWSGQLLSAYFEAQEPIRLAFDAMSSLIIGHALLMDESGAYLTDELGQRLVVLEVESTEFLAAMQSAQPVLAGSKPPAIERTVRPYEYRQH